MRLHRWGSVDADDGAIIDDRLMIDDQSAGSYEYYHSEAAARRFAPKPREEVRRWLGSLANHAATFKRLGEVLKFRRPQARLTKLPAPVATATGDGRLTQTELEDLAVSGALTRDDCVAMLCMGYARHADSDGQFGQVCGITVCSDATVCYRHASFHCFSVFAWC